MSAKFPRGGSRVISSLQSKWTASNEFGTYRLCKQRRFRQACASVQSRQNLCCSLIQAVSQEEPSDRKPDPWPLWMAGHAQLKFVMTECSKIQIRLTRLKWSMRNNHFPSVCLVNPWVPKNCPVKTDDSVDVLADSSLLHAHHFIGSDVPLVSFCLYHMFFRSSAEVVWHQRGEGVPVLQASAGHIPGTPQERSQRHRQVAQDSSRMWRLI